MNKRKDRPDEHRGGCAKFLTILGVKFKELFLFRAPLAAELTHHLNFLRVDTNDTVTHQLSHFADFLAHFRELLRLKGASLVAAPHAPFQSDVGLNNGGAHGHRFYCRHNAGEVAGETDRNLWKDSSKRINGFEIDHSTHLFTASCRFDVNYPAPRAQGVPNYRLNRISCGTSFSRPWFLMFRLVHKDIYIIGHTLAKRDKLGIHAIIENLCVEILALAVKGAFQSKEIKLGALKLLRVNIEVMKHLIRTEHELGVIKEPAYLRLAGQFVEISKMMNGWIAYTQKGA